MHSSNKKNIWLSVFNQVKAGFGSLLVLLKISKKNKEVVDHKGDLDKKLVYSLSKSRVPNMRQLKYLKRFLSPRELFFLRAATIIVFIALVGLGFNFYTTNLKTVPAVGGEYIEGIIGAPKYINPLYDSLNDTDADLSRLVFSSLFKRDFGGNLVPDLAASYEISSDNLEYTIKVRSDAKWHNGDQLTADDVIFTFNTFKDSQYNSPLANDFSNVDIVKVDEDKVKFILSEPYAPFLEMLTFGILPQSLWEQISPAAASLTEFNVKPVGSGPYKFKSLTKDKSGNLLLYSLVVNDDYYGTKPFLTNITFKFFGSTEEAVAALNDGSINGINYLAPKFRNSLAAKDSLKIYKLNLPKINALFFNLDDSSLKDQLIRQALAMAVNRNNIINQVMQDYAIAIDGPIMPNSFAYDQNLKKYQYDKTRAAELLKSAGWELQEITAADIETATNKNKEKDVEKKERASNDAKIAQGVGKWLVKKDNFFNLKLTTVDSDEDRQVVELVKKDWQDVGIKVTTEIIPANQVQSDVIKNRNFQVLLFGQIVGADPDVYAFWHSSQKSGDGLNITGFTDKNADKLLEDARAITDKNIRRDKYMQFQSIISDQVPAIFLYSPVYAYVQNKSVKGFNVNVVYTPADRFNNIADWYTKTKKEFTSKPSL